MILPPATGSSSPAPTRRSDIYNGNAGIIRRIEGSQITVRLDGADGTLLAFDASRVQGVPARLCRHDLQGPGPHARPDLSLSFRALAIGGELRGAVAAPREGRVVRRAPDRRRPERNSRGRWRGWTSAAPPRNFSTRGEQRRPGAPADADRTAGASRRRAATNAATDTTGSGAPSCRRRKRNSNDASATDQGAKRDQGKGEGERPQRRSFAEDERQKPPLSADDGRAAPPEIARHRGTRRGVRGARRRQRNPAAWTSWLYGAGWRHG